MYTGFAMPANRLQKVAFSGIQVPCTIYDVKETDLTKKVIGKFPTLSDAADFLKIKANYVTKIIQDKSRHKNKHLGKTITIR